MALTKPRTNSEYPICESTTSIATTPVAMSAIAPVAGYIQRVMAASSGTTTGTITVAVTVNGGSDIAGGALTIAAGAGGAGSVVELPLVGASAVWVNEGDLIVATPSGGTGSSIGGAFAAVIRGIV